MFLSGIGTVVVRYFSSSSSSRILRNIGIISKVLYRLFRNLIVNVSTFMEIWKIVR